MAKPQQLHPEQHVQMVQQWADEAARRIKENISIINIPVQELPFCNWGQCTDVFVQRLTHNGVTLDQFQEASRAAWTPQAG